MNNNKELINYLEDENESNRKGLKKNLNCSPQYWNHLIQILFLLECLLSSQNPLQELVSWLYQYQRELFVECELVIKNYMK